jgi:hypothetical protein
LIKREKCFEEGVAPLGAGIGICPFDRCVAWTQFYGIDTMDTFAPRHLVGDSNLTGLVEKEEIQFEFE